jgi:hypothetical protein
LTWEDVLLDPWPGLREFEAVDLGDVGQVHLELPAERD